MTTEERIAEIRERLAAVDPMYPTGYRGRILISTDLPWLLDELERAQKVLAEATRAALPPRGGQQPIIVGAETDLGTRRAE